MHGKPYRERRVSGYEQRLRTEYAYRIGKHERSRDVNSERLNIVRRCVRSNDLVSRSDLRIESGDNGGAVFAKTVSQFFEKLLFLPILLRPIVRSSLVDCRQVKRFATARVTRFTHPFEERFARFGR